MADDGTPTALYDQLKDKTTTKTVLATQIKSLYSELYAINVEIHNASEEDTKGAIGRVTGKDEDGVNRIYNTFKALCNVADFSEFVSDEESSKNDLSEDSAPPTSALPSPTLQFHYNIQIHLPATTDISVYNAIFKSLKDNLFI